MRLPPCLRLVPGTPAGPSAPQLCPLNPVQPPAFSFLRLRTLSPSGSRDTGLQLLHVISPQSASPSSQGGDSEPAPLPSRCDRSESQRTGSRLRPWQVLALDEAPGTYSGKAESAYFRLCWPDGLCCSNTTLWKQRERSQRYYAHEWM